MRRDPHLVGEDLHRRGDVERAEMRRDGDPDQGVAPIELRVGESGALAAEHHRDRGARGLRDGASRALARVEHGPFDPAGPCRRAEYVPAIGEGVVQGLDDSRLVQDVVGSRRPGRGFRAGKPLRGHEDEPIEPHRLHRPGRRPDVARVRRLDQHDAHAMQGSSVLHPATTRLRGVGRPDRDRTARCNFARNPPRRQSRTGGGRGLLHASFGPRREGGPDRTGAGSRSSTIMRRGFRVRRQAPGSRRPGRARRSRAATGGPGAA